MTGDTRFSAAFINIARILEQTVTNKQQQEPWEIDKNRSSPGNYVLNSTDRTYCASDKSQNKTRKSDIRTRIKEKRIEKLPNRIQDLIDDIALIQYTNDEFLSKEEWNELYEDMCDVENRSKEALKMDIFFSSENYFNNEVQFGFELGAMIRALSQRRHNSNDVLWGFMLGLNALPPRAVEIEEEFLSDALEDLIQKVEQRSESMHKRKETNAKERSVSDENKERVLNTMKDYDMTLETVPISFYDIYTSYEFSGYPFPPEEINSAICENSDLKILQSIDDLRWDVEHDGTMITEKHFRGEEAMPIIRELWEKVSELNSEITQDGLSSDNMDSVNSERMAQGLLNKLSGKEDKEQDSIHPIVTEDGSDWKLTMYGGIVAYSLFETNGWYPWIYKYELFGQSIPDELCELIDEINNQFDYW